MPPLKPSAGQVFYALAHSEWYACLQYGNDPVKGCSVGQNQLNSWVNAITMFSSSDGGATWSPLGGNNAAHVVLAPSMPYPADWEFWKFATIRNYGFFHPSNIVEQNSFYYATAGYHGTCIERHQITSMYWGQFC